jgi:hypothetical protein
MLLLSAICVPTPVYAGGGSTGGGKGVQCSADAAHGFPKDGFYALDYAVGIQKNGGEWYVVNNDPMAHLKTIAEVFRTKLSDYYPRAAKELTKFTADFEQIWRTLDFELESTNDAWTEGLPPNCKFETLIQVTTKIDSEYLTRPELASKLKNTGVTQWSTHLLHEMLRVAFNRSKFIEQWNQVLHSRDFFNLNQESLVQYLLKRGVMNNQTKIEGDTSQTLALIYKKNGCRGLSKFYNQKASEADSSMDNLNSKLEKLTHEQEVVSKAALCTLVQHQIPFIRMVLLPVSIAATKALAITEASSIPFHEYDCELDGYFLMRSKYFALSDALTDAWYNWQKSSIYCDIQTHALNDELFPKLNNREY